MRVLVAALGSIGDLNPHLSVAVALADRGHEVTFASSAAYRGRAERLGLRFAPMPPDVPDWSTSPGLVERMMDARRGTERVLRELVLPSLREGYREIEAEAAAADLVVSGLLAFPARLAAERHGRPWASTALQPAVMFSPDDPSVMTGLPGAGALVRLPAVLQHAALSAASFYTHRWMAPWDALRRELGLGPPDGNPLLRGQHSALASLALFSPRFAPRRPSWPPSIVECGFPFDSRVDGLDLPDGVSRFLNEGPPPLVFTLGSAASLEPGDFYRQSAAAARAMGRRAVLVGDPGAAPGPAPGQPDAWNEPWLPLPAVFQRAAAVVHHGGIGVLSHALAAGKPMLVVPHAHDQPDNARRAERLGVALALPRRRYDAGRAAAALDRLTGDPAFAGRAGRIAGAVLAERGGVAAAAALERAADGR